MENEPKCDNNFYFVNCLCCIRDLLDTYKFYKIRLDEYIRHRGVSYIIQLCIERK